MVGTLEGFGDEVGRVVGLELGRLLGINEGFLEGEVEGFKVGVLKGAFVVGLLVAKYDGRIDDGNTLGVVIGK